MTAALAPEETPLPNLEIPSRAYQLYGLKGITAKQVVHIPKVYLAAKDSMGFLQDVQQRIVTHAQQFNAHVEHDSRCEPLERSLMI